MKNRKVWSLGLIICMALCLALAACSGGSGSGKSNAPAPDPEKIEGEEVTEKEWNNAIAFAGVDNVTVEVKATDGTDDNFSSIICRLDGNKMYLKQEEVYADSPERNDKEETYYVQENGAVFKYSRVEFDSDNEIWVYLPSREETLSGEGISHMTDVDDLYNNYEDFTYDAKQKAYVAEEDRGTITVKIADGKLRYVKSTGWNAGDGGAYTVQCYNYGTTKVTLPQATGEQVTQAQWEKAFNIENATCTMRTNLGGNLLGGSLMSVICKRDGNREETLRTVGGGTESHEYRSKENEKIYTYTYDSRSGKWTRTIDDGEWGNLIGFDCEYADFTYNKQAKTYSGTVDKTQVTVQFQGGKIRMVYACFDDVAVATFVFSDYGTTKVTLPKDYVGQ